MKRLSAIFALTVSMPLSFTFACGGDDDAPSNSGGRSGSSNAPTGGKNTSGGAPHAGASSEPEAGAGNTSTGESGAGGGGQTGSPEMGGSAGDGGSGGATPNENVIEGRVIDPMGSARAGVSVIVEGRSDLTDAEGYFRFENVGGTYDVLAFPTDGQTAFVYQGITRRNPILIVNAEDRVHTSRVSGMTDYPASAVTSFFGRVGLASHKHAGVSSPLDLKAQTYGPLEISWTGAERYKQDLLALVWIRKENEEPLEYLGFGEAAVDVRADEEDVNADIHVDDLSEEKTASTRSLSISGQVPEGYQVLRHGLEFGTIPLLDKQTDALSASYNVPSGLKTGHLVFTVESAMLETPEGPAVQRSTAQWVVTDDQEKLDFELPAAPTPVVPLNGAAGVNKSTLFQWQPFTGGIHRLEVSWGESHVVVYTQADSTKLPDLAVVGLAYPSDGEFEWKVSGLGPVESIDEWVASADPLVSLGALHSAESETRAFTISE
ncbi:MAG TPA: carboxypeptidase-like regulatory domain-containing protein [Polyangiaceae bacterium]|nr:carboxypeptidase-like regulatory domain-containing protein [Polyangiaceae bacterium]